MNSINRATNLEIYLKSLQDMHEDDLSKSIIKPLFESMGYSRVDFHGGPHERGKDLIALMSIPPNKKYHVSVIQTKKIGNSQKSIDVPVIRKLISQLQQCFTHKFPTIDGEMVKPDKVYLACPEQITSRLLDEINDQLVLPDHEVIPFDGPRIIELIKEYQPNLLEILITFEHRLFFKQEDQLKNIELYSALNRKTEFDFINCYSDLNFFVGSVSSNLLLSASLNIRGSSLSLDSESWDKFKKITESLNERIGFNSLLNTIKHLELNFEKEMEKHNSKENIETKNSIVEVSKWIQKTVQEISSIENSVRSVLQRLGKSKWERMENTIAIDTIQGITSYLGRIKIWRSSLDFDSLDKLSLDTSIIEHGEFICEVVSDVNITSEEVGCLINFHDTLRAIRNLENKTEKPKTLPKKDDLLLSIEKTINSLLNLSKKETEKLKNGEVGEYIDKTLAKTEDFRDSIISADCEYLSSIEIDADLIEHLRTIIQPTKNAKTISSEIGSLVTSVRSVFDSNSVRSKSLDNYVKFPTYNINLNKASIEKWLETEANDYKEHIRKINNQSFNVSSLQGFLQRTENSLTVIELLTSDNNPAKDLTTVEYNISDEICRIDLSPHKVIDSGRNIAIYGGAGVGKTTTLQMYAKNFISNGTILIYLPLNRLLAKYKKVYSAIVSSLDESKFTSPYDYDYDELASEDRVFIDEEVISRLILISKGVECTAEELFKLEGALRSSPNFKLILDGLDEAYDNIPFILSSINHFKDKYPSSQLVISSRDCASYLSEIDFLGITLLPFTDEKLFKFVDGWFKEDEKSKRVINELKNKNLVETVRTPLLATIMCSLVDEGLKIPSSESSIYLKRLSLLCGEYDIYKKIRRQTLSPDILKSLAISIALELHSRSTRSASREQIIQLLLSDSTILYEQETINRAVDELINPCNILVKDFISGELSLGHFRFQEHLVSISIRENRSVDLIPLLGSEFWRGAFVLYAQSNKIFHIFDDHLSSSYNYSHGKATLREMFLERPSNERESLDILLKGNLEADRMDDIVMNDFEYSNY